jgi:hypothetical protein
MHATTSATTSATTAGRKRQQRRERDYGERDLNSTPVAPQAQ